MHFLLVLIFLLPFNSVHNDSVITLSEFNITLKELISQNKWGRNPFLPYYNLEHSETELATDIYQPKLTKIFIDKEHRKAVINNEVLSKGEMFFNMSVSYIGESLVVLQKEDGQFIILKSE